MFGKQLWTLSQSARRGTRARLWLVPGLLMAHGGLWAAPVQGVKGVAAVPAFSKIVTVAAPVTGKLVPAPRLVVTTAVTASYGLPDGTDEDSPSNAASFIVDKACGVAVQPASAFQQAAPGVDVAAFPLQIQNTGSGSDSFAVSTAVPDGWSATLVQDDNGDGKFQPEEATKLTLPLALGAGQSVRCFVRVSYPADADKSETVSARLVSQADPSQSAVFSGTVSAGQAASPAFAAAWRVQTGGPVLGEATVQGGIAYVGSDDGALYAIAATAGSGRAPGTVLWHRQTNARVRCAPAVYKTLAGREQVTVGNEAGRLTTWDAATGQPLWSAFVGLAHLSSWRARPLVSPDGSLVTVPAGGAYLSSFTTTQGLLRRRALWQEGALAGNPAPAEADGGAWLVGTNGWGSWVRDGVPTRRVSLGGASAGSLVLDTAQNCLLGVTASGHVAAFDLASLLPNPRWAGEGAADLNVSVVASPALDAANGLLYVAGMDHMVYALHTADGTMEASGWPFVPGGAAGSAFRAAPLLWPSQDGAAPTLYVGDTGGGFYAVPTDRPDQALVFTQDANAMPLGEWDAAPAASGTGPEDVVVAGNSNGIVYGFPLR